MKSCSIVEPILIRKTLNDDDDDDDVDMILHVLVLLEMYLLDVWIHGHIMFVNAFLLLCIYLRVTQIYLCTTFERVNRRVFGILLGNCNHSLCIGDCAWRILAFL